MTQAVDECPDSAGRRFGWEPRITVRDRRRIMMDADLEARGSRFQYADCTHHRDHKVRWSSLVKLCVAKGSTVHGLIRLASQVHTQRLQQVLTWRIF